MPAQPTGSIIMNTAVDRVFLVAQSGNKGASPRRFTDSWDPEVKPIWIYQTVSTGRSRTLRVTSMKGRPLDSFVAKCHGRSKREGGDGDGEKNTFGVDGSTRYGGNDGGYCGAGVC